MASSPILHRGSYDHYKTRTKVFINWLTEAARKCCKLEDVVGALKDRAGKRAKKNGEEILLTTQEIISLCQKVARKKKVMIPAWILRLLKNVIASRTEYTAFYSALSAAEGSALDRSNAGHAHFIDVLQQAHDIFAALDESRIAKRNKLVSTPTLKPLRNLFEHLKIRDAPGAQPGGDGVEAAAEAELEEEEFEQRAADAPRINFKVKVDRKEEILVQLVHLLGDCKTLRMEIEDTFKQYVCGEVTYEVACTVASIGFGLIRRTCERFTDQHSKFGDHAYMLKFLGFRMEQHETLVAVSLEGTSGHRREDSATGAPDPKTSEETRRLLPPNHDTTSLLCASGAGIMLGLLEEFQSPRDDHEASRHGSAHLLHDGIPELQKLKENPASNPAVLKPAIGFWWGDEFLSGILNYTFGDERGLPMWLAVVTQCYRNIYDVLGGRMDCGMENDSKRWKRFLNMIESAEEFQNCEGETPVVRIIDEWSGLFNLLRSNFSGPHGTKKPFMFDSDGHGPPPMHLITKLPTVTAGMSLSPTANMYTHGYSIANTNLVIHCAAHLYAACRSTKLIRDDLHWRDMDFILEHHKLYTDMVPGADPYSMINHFYISLGVRRSTLAKAKADIDRRRFKVRWIAQKSPFLVKYASAAIKVQKEGREVRNLTVVDAMLEALTHCFDLELRHKSAKFKQKRYTPIELLSAFKRILIEDEPERNFNMIGFSQQCSAFVAEARAQLSGGDTLRSCTPIVHSDRPCSFYPTPCVTPEGRRNASL